MKKLMKVALLVMAMCLLLSGCQNLPSINVPFDLPFDLPFLHQHEWQDATCEAPKTCACGATEGEALGHKPGAAATCTADQTCTVCKAVLKKATGHTEETLEAKAPTCTATGLTEGKKCSVCGTVTVKQDVIPANGHTEETLASKAPTCTETGLTEGKKCTVCGTVTVKQDIIPANGHTEETVAGKAPTCTETGLTEGKKCTVCGTTTVAQNEIPANGHSNDGSNRCSICGTNLCSKDNHIEEIIPSKAATCTETGLTEGKKCSACGDILVAQTETPATGHTEETLAAKAPTCTETGLTEGKKCSVCGTTTAPQNVVPANGHTEETLEAKAPTCTATGLTEGKKCSVCGTTTVAQDEVPANGHSYTDHVCTVCGKDDPDHYFVMTIPEALEAKDGKKVEVSGTVCEASAWSSGYKNMNVTIVDTDGNKLYVYRLATEVKLGDIITVKGAMATFNGNRQIAQGGTAEVTGHDTNYDAVPEFTITDALAAKDGTNMIVTGTVVEINGKWNSQYNNMNVTIADENGNKLYVYRLATQVTLNDVIAVKGSKTSYNGAPQIGEGSTAEIKGTHTCSKYHDATCAAPQTCVVCGATVGEKTENHSWDDATCTAPKTCSVCKATDGEALGHTTENGTCERCEKEISSDDPKGYIKVTSKDQLTSGTYVIVLSSEPKYALGKYDSTGWILTASPSIDGNTVTDTAGATWTLTFSDAGVTIKDANGTYIKPKSGNNNGIQTGEYTWAYEMDANGNITFKGTGSDTTALAANIQSDYKLRSYKISTLTGNNASGYISTFNLYKLYE